MTPDEASRFSRRMIDTWPNGPKAYVWVHVAEGLDVDHARTAVAMLERTAERAPTPAQFHAAYMTAYHAAERDRMPMSCELCDGTGWLDASRIRDGHVHSASRPCRCTIGDQRRHVYGRILESNAR